MLGNICLHRDSFLEKVFHVVYLRKFRLKGPPHELLFPFCICKALRSICVTILTLEC